MTVRPRAAGLAYLAVAVVVGAGTAAAAAPELIAEHRNWAVYRYHKGGGAACYLAALPLNRRGPASEWKPSWILVDVDPTVTPGYTVSFALGRPLDEPTRVRLTIGRRHFELIPEGDTAWTPDAKADLRMVVAMKRGRRMVVSAKAASGATVLDTFSLMGFTNALHDATACGRESR